MTRFQRALWDSLVLAALASVYVVLVGVVK